MNNLFAALVIGATALTIVSRPALSRADDSPPPEVGISQQAANARLVVKYDWTLSTTGGAGGALGMQFGRFEVGLMGFATPLPGQFRDTFLTGAAGHQVTLNWGAEIYGQWYASPSRRGWFAGGLVSLDGFGLKDQATDTKHNVHALYIAPRVGLRIPLGGEWFFFEPSLGAAMRLWDDSLGNDAAVIHAQPIAPLTFLTLGCSLPL